MRVIKPWGEDAPLCVALEAYDPTNGRQLVDVEVADRQCERIISVDGQQSFWVAYVPSGREVQIDLKTYPLWITDRKPLPRPIVPR